MPWSLIFHHKDKLSPCEVSTSNSQSAKLKSLWSPSDGQRDHQHIHVSSAYTLHDTKNSKKAKWMYCTFLSIDSVICFVSMWLDY